jgi:serine/threonine protein kinase
MFCEDSNTSSSASSINSLEEYDCQTLLITQEFEFINPLSNAKFPVFLTQSKSTKDYFAMKIFPFDEGKVVSLYYNEIRFANLTHPNIITIVHHEAHNNLHADGKSMDFSYILLEYAPYGDFYDVLMIEKVPFDDKLVRTYFHQLIEGLEFLHSKGIAHLDIKPENLLLGNNFQLKIADFDLSYMQGDHVIESKGTQNYRAPELVNDQCQIPEAADMFSAAIILFVLKSGTILPQTEGSCIRGFNLYHLLQNKNQEFWSFHNSLKKQSNFYNEDFKELFNGMTKDDATKRITLKQIKSFKWYNEDIYNNEELIRVMRKHLNL